ncbi:MAG TPA: phosphoribosylaminoimidazolesuccinocarboxamide synthase [Gemmatimonadaceae bacterium]|nr:phosphoribosylaminoimidazolesuccinocarboxamide synthase [Gemmatimonadaceae bacterium]
MSTVAATDFPLPLVRRGKVRDVYDAGGDRLLLVATDRVSAFDVVMDEAVPHKGAVLTQLTAWWLRTLGNDIRHHMLSADAEEIAREVPAVAGFRADLGGRSMLALKTKPFPVECVMRGFLAGSAWQEYRARGTLAGEPLPPGLPESARLDPPLFSPATKAESGHDRNITVAEAARMVGTEAAAELERLTRLVYDRGSTLAAARGIILADTKLEFGERSGEIILIDEVLTPDSSRFWAAESYRPGAAPPGFDKQPLRDYLAQERAAGRWNGEAPAPSLPSEVVAAMSARYLEIFRRLTGSQLVTPA